jgi:hypothetical protein
MGGGLDDDLKIIDDAMNKKKLKEDVNAFNIFSKIINYINENKLKKKILYYNEKEPWKGFNEKKKNMKQIETTKYYPINENMYIIINYDIEDCVLNWCGCEDRRHRGTYAGLRLLKTNKKLFDQILNDAKNLTKEEFKEKYLSNISKTIVKSAISIWQCNQFNIDIENEFKLLKKYISTNQKEWKILFRGERRYENLLSKSEIVEYNNIHTWADNEDEAFKFSANLYSTYDENIKQYIFITCFNIHAARINPILYHDMRLNKAELDWVEYLHLPSKYLIFDYETKSKTVKYKNNESHKIDVIYLTYQEV